MKIFAGDSQKAESLGLKTAIKLNVSKYPVIPRGRCDSQLVSFRKKILEVSNFMKISSECLAERN